MTPLPLRVVHAHELSQTQPALTEAGWRLDAFVGRLIELSAIRGAASLTLAMDLVHQAQLGGEPTAWVCSGKSLFFGPDAGAMGVDLRALPIIWAHDLPQGARHVDKLLRSGAFGLVILDVERGGFVPAPLMGRLMKLAEKHRARVLFLTRKTDEAPSVGGLVSWRGRAWRKPMGAAMGTSSFEIEVEVLKDKRRGPGGRHREVYGGPPGLR